MSHRRCAECAAWLTVLRACGVQTVAAHVVRLLASRLADVPYCIIGHSVGTWIAFETLSLAREQGLPMPRKARLRACTVACEHWRDAAGLNRQVFFSCFPAPDIPLQERPWKVRAKAHC